MSSPKYYDDGKFNLAAQNGATSFSFPFASKGDNQTFIARKKMRVASGAIQIPALMQAEDFTLGRAFYADRTDASDIGQGLVEYEAIYASLPATRTEYGTITYTQQYLLSGEIIEYTSTRDAAFL